MRFVSMPARTNILTSFFRASSTIIIVVLLSVFFSESAVFAKEKRVSFQGESLFPGVKTYKIPALVSRPKGEGPFPALVLLPHCGGMDYNVTKFWPRYLNKLGYVTLTIDNLKPRGLKRCNLKLLRDKRTLTQDAVGALKYISQLNYVDNNRIGAIGYSMGGATMGAIANRNPTVGGVGFKTGVILYAGCGHLGGSAAFPVLAVLGSKEKFVDVCRRMGNTVPSLETKVIPGAYHAFDQPIFKKLRKDPAGHKVLYSAKATKQAQAYVKDFLAANLKHRVEKSPKQTTDSKTNQPLSFDGSWVITKLSPRCRGAKTLKIEISGSDVSGRLVSPGTGNMDKNTGDLFFTTAVGAPVSIRLSGDSGSGTIGRCPISLQKTGAMDERSPNRVRNNPVQFGGKNLSVNENLPA